MAEVLSTPVATHQVGWATVTGDKYHHYDKHGRTRCGYQRRKGELSFRENPTSLSAWQCCSTCASIAPRTDAPVAAPAKFNYATDGQHLADVRAEQDRTRAAGRRYEPVASFGYSGQADYETQHALGAFDADGYELHRGDKVMLAPAYANGNERVGTINCILYHPVKENRRPDIEVSFSKGARLAASKGTWLDTHLLLSGQARRGRLRLERPAKPSTPTSVEPSQSTWQKKQYPTTQAIQLSLF